MSSLNFLTSLSTGYPYTNQDAQVLLGTQLGCNLTLTKMSLPTRQLLLYPSLNRQMLCAINIIVTQYLFMCGSFNQILCESQLLSQGSLNDFTEIVQQVRNRAEFWLKAIQIRSHFSFDCFNYHQLFLKFSFLFNNLYKCVYVQLCVCVSIGACGGQQKAPDPLELELQVVVSHLTGALGTEPRSSTNAVRVPHR